MKATIKAKTLGNALKAVCKAMDNRPSEALYELTLCEWKNNRLHLTAQGDKQSMTISVPCTIGEEGKVALDGKKLQALCTTLADVKVTLSTENGKCYASYGGGRIQLPCDDGKDWEVRPSDWEDSLSLTLTTGMMSEGLAGTSFAMHTDVNRPVMCSVYFAGDDKATTYVASNTLILSARQYRTSLNKEKWGVILPARLVSLLSVLPKSDETELSVKISPDATKVSFSWTGVTITADAEVGKYPDWQSIIPQKKNWIGTMEFSRSAVLSAINRTALCAGKNGTLFCTLKDQSASDVCKGLTIESEDDVFAISAKEEVMGTDYRGKELGISFKMSNLQAIISHIGGDDELTMGFAGSNRASVVQSKSEDGERIDICVVMPNVMRKSEPKAVAEKPKAEEKPKVEEEEEPNVNVEDDDEETPEDDEEVTTEEVTTEEEEYEGSAV